MRLEIHSFGPFYGVALWDGEILLAYATGVGGFNLAIPESKINARETFWFLVGYLDLLEHQVLKEDSDVIWSM